MFSIVPLQDLDIGDMYRQIKNSRETLTELGWLIDADWDRFYQHYHSIILHKKLNIFAVRLDDDYAGSVEISDNGDHYQLGYWLGIDYRGQGIATEAIRSVLNQLDDRPVTADTLIDNPSSYRLLERLGFELERTNETHRFYRLTQDK
jgi:RimJ/RimL family protein N-acetyltransferase